MLEYIFKFTKECELIENGKFIMLTKPLLMLYVESVSNFYLSVQFKDIIPQIKKGISFSLNTSDMRRYTLDEIQNLLSRDAPTIDIEDMSKNTVYYQYTADSQVIIWLWQILRSSSVEFKQKFLKFATGSQNPPLFGFNMMSPKLAISILDKGDNHMPIAHTCFNKIHIPNYSTKSIFREKLENAIYSNSGFEMT